jgi:hypothetical protein
MDTVSRETPDPAAQQLARIAKMGVDRMQSVCEVWNALTDELIVPLVMVLKVENGAVARMQMVGPQLDGMTPEMLTALFEQVLAAVKQRPPEVMADDIVPEAFPEQPPEQPLQ